MPVKGEILPDNPKSFLYGPGSTISGNVRLESSGKETCLGIYIRLHGFAETNFKQSSSSNYYEGNETLIDEHVQLLGVPNKRLPDTVVESDFKIEYSISSYLKKWEDNSQIVLDTLPVKIHTCLDLNEVPDAGKPVEQEETKQYVSCCCFFRNEQNCFIKSSTSKQGYTPGEMIPLTLTFNNETRQAISKIEASLVQIWTISGNYFEKSSTKKHVVPLDSVERAEDVKPGEKITWKVTLTIPEKAMLSHNKSPDDPPCCEIVQLMNAIKVTGTAPGWDNTLKLIHPIVIGNVALCTN